MGLGASRFDWNPWFQRWTNLPKRQLEINLNSNGFRAPDEAAVLKKGAEKLHELLKLGEIEFIKFDLQVPPNVPGTKPTNHVENHHVVPYFLPVIVAAAQEHQSPITDLAIPMFRLNERSGLVQLLPSLPSLVSLTLLNVTNEAFLISILEAFTRKAKSSKYPLQDLRIIYEFDRCSRELALAVCALLATDTLVAFKMSKNKIWSRKGLVETGLDDNFVKLMAKSMLHITNLAFLDLSNNKITDVGADCLVSVLAKNPNMKLEALRLTKNVIDESTVGLLTECVKGDRNDVFSEVDFSRNRISEGTFIKLLPVVEKTNYLQYVGLHCHDFNLDAYRVKHGTVARTNNRRLLEMNEDDPMPMLRVGMSGNSEKAGFGYSFALPAWGLCGACCLLQGPFTGDEMNLTNIVQGRCTKLHKRGGLLGFLSAILVGLFFVCIALFFPWVVMRDDVPTTLSPTQRAIACLTMFIAPLIGWIALILYTAVTDPSGQWIAIENPSYSARWSPNKTLAKNVIQVVVLLLDFLQLVSLDFASPDRQEHPDTSGQLNNFFRYFYIDFGASAWEYSFYGVVILVGIWWLIAVYVIASVAIKKPENALGLFNAELLIPVLSSAAFLTVTTVLLKSLACTYTSSIDPISGDVSETAYLTATCRVKELGRYDLELCGPYVMTCWEGRHRLLASVGMYCLTIYILSAPTVGSFFNEDHSGDSDIQYIESFMLLERLMKFLMSCAIIFFVESLWVPSLITVSAKAILCYASYKFMPCQHIAWVNFMRIGLYALAFWSGICALIAKGLSSNAIFDSPIPFNALVAGWSVILFFMLIFMCYGKFSTDKRKAKHARAKMMRSGHMMALELTESEANMSPSLAAMGTWGKTIRAGKRSIRPESPRPNGSGKSPKLGKEEVVKKKHGKKVSQPDLRDVNFEDHPADEEKHLNDNDEGDAEEDEHAPHGDEEEADAGAPEQEEMYDEEAAGDDPGDEEEPQGEYDDDIPEAYDDEPHGRDDPYAEEQEDDVEMQQVRHQKGGKRKG